MVNGSGNGQWVTATAHRWQFKERKIQSFRF
jgi:hypothetical protein